MQQKKKQERKDKTSTACIFLNETMSIISFTIQNIKKNPFHI